VASTGADVALPHIASSRKGSSGEIDLSTCILDQTLFLMSIKRGCLVFDPETVGFEVVAVEEGITVRSQFCGVHPVFGGFLVVSAEVFGSFC
jgi:hypothetical protein